MTDFSNTECHTIICNTCHRRVEAEPQSGTDIAATGELTVSFQLRGDVLLLALPADQLRSILTAYDEAKAKAAREQAEAVFLTPVSRSEDKAS